MKRIVPVMMLCLGVAVASPAFGQKKKAKALFDAGVTALEQKNYEKALSSFQDAYEVSPHWAVLAHIGTCYAKLNRPEKAIEAFEKYLADGGDKIPPDERKTAEQLISQQKRKLGVLVLSVGKEGVEALVDGASIGKSPFEEVVLPPGQHEVAVVFGENDVVRRNIDVVAGQEFLLRIEQETHVSNAPPEAAFTEETREREGVSSMQEESDALPMFSPPPAAAEVKGSPVPFAVMLGITLADAVAVGVSWGFFTYYTASANNYQTTLDGMSAADSRWSDYTWEDTCSQSVLLTDEEVYYCNTEINRRDFLNKADTWKIVGIATSATLVVTATVAIIFGVNRHWFGGSKGETAALSVSPMLGPEQNGLMLNLQF